jgi:plasmid maintenance system antidote protein VapI
MRRLFGLTGNPLLLFVWELKLKTTAQYLDEVKEILHLPSDYALAKYWKVSKQDISEYRSGKRTLGEDRAIEVARTLGINPAEPLLASHAERAKSENARQIWIGVLEKITASFETIMLLTAPRPSL